MDGELDDGGLEHVAPLGEDKIPDANQAHHCFSCGEDMEGLFCYACGNKNDNYRRSIWSLGIELFGSLTALEGRMWRSVKSLIISPGEMAREFADGARQKWTSPVRFYLAMSLILFGYIAISQTQLIAFGTVLGDVTVESNADETKTATGSPQIFFLQRKKTIASMVSEDAIKNLESNFDGFIVSDNEKSLETLNEELIENRETFDDFQERLDDPAMRYGRQGLKAGQNAVARRIEVLEAIIAKRESGEITQVVNFETPEGDDEPPENGSGEDSESEITGIEWSGSTLNITGLDGNSMTLGPDEIQAVVGTILREPDRLNAPISTYVPRIMFLMMPLSMLMGAIFIRGRENAMLYDHLVHAAYIHTFSFLLLFVFILLTQFTPVPGLIYLYTLILLVYLPMSAKRMFSRGWFKTILVSYSVGITYTLVMGIILITLIMVGFVGVAADVSQSR